ncbi:unnamed protein product [Rotaria magnacalcarata]|uniref:Uncharacterized protein n=2 Tax=Rotaria magnacalcarata TaxID=392030 RepID=A0A8S3AEN5_9BILA|nr:unnamed protein product [Rotaria magnacalcarata]
MILTDHSHGHETTRRHGVDFPSEQSTAPSRINRQTSIGHQSLSHDILSAAAGSISCNIDPNRSCIVSCLVPASIAVFTR